VCVSVRIESGEEGKIDVAVHATVHYKAGSSTPGAKLKVAGAYYRPQNAVETPEFRDASVPGAGPYPQFRKQPCYTSARIPFSASQSAPHGSCIAASVWDELW
jgi:hypothetical protein